LARQLFADATLVRPAVMFGPNDAFLTTILKLLRQLPIYPMFGRGLTRLQPVAAWLFLFFPHLGGPPSRRDLRCSRHRCAQYCYYHKADQCARLAKDAIEPRKRSDFETERELWLQIAEQIEMDEVRWFGPEPM
jgi:hypothetical protein